MAEIKLIASDLDGTLLTSDKKITPRLLSALEKAVEKGISFVPATGRVFESIPESIKTMPFLKYVICSNGAVIYDAVEKKNIIENYLDEKAVEETMDVLEGRNVVVEIFKDGKAYTDRKVYENLSDYGIFGGHAEYVLTTRLPVDDLYEEIKKCRNCLENINLIFNDDDERMEVWRLLKEKNHASVTTSAHNNIEVTAKKATKANALSDLCKMLDIEKENVIAFGDSNNDIDMIEFSGIGVAMANGDDEIKNKADIITENCDNFGVAVILEKIINNEF